MIKIVKVNKQAMAFCKYTIAGLVWLSVILTNMIPIYVVFLIMLASAILGVDKAPLVFLFNHTFGKLIKQDTTYVNMNSIRFSHIVGCAFCIIGLILFYFTYAIIAYIVLVVFALLQTIASFGYCSAQKLYECVVCNNNCCNFGKKIRSIKKND